LRYRGKTEKGIPGSDIRDLGIHCSASNSRSSRFKIYFLAYMEKQAIFPQYVVKNNEDFFFRQVFFWKSQILNQVHLIWNINVPYW
jgi:hypothetical protein